jgi:hypothetical protein
VVASGNDTLLWIDGDADSSSRPLLRDRWTRAGFTCVRHSHTVRCSNGNHGFDLSAQRFSVF